MIHKTTKTILRTLALALTICATCRAWAVYAPGDTIEWSNANTSAPIYSGTDPAVINECHFDFQIPASADLPARSVVKIKSITFASLNTDGKFYREQNNYKSDPGFINLNGVKSDAVNGVTFSSDNYTGTFTDKINSTTTQEDYALKYTFTSECRISVGVNYPAATAASKGATGYGIAFLHPNGNCIYGSSTDKASVRYVQSPASDALITPYESTSSTTGKGNGKVAKDAGYYPVYIVKAEVVSIADLTPDFEYNTTAGSVTVANRSGTWMDSLSNGGNADLGLYRVGPGGSGMVCDVGSVTTPPYSGMAGKTSPFSFAIYADVSQVPSSTTKHVIVDFGKSGVNKLVLYRLGDNLQLGFFDGSNNGLGAHATLPVPASGYHFIAGVCDTSTGTVTLYVDSASNTQTRNTATTLGDGFQLASIHSNNAGFGKGTGFALSKFIGYNTALTGEEIATIRADYPATDGTQITADISPSISGKTLTVYDSEATGNQYLGITAGTLTIPANNTVTVPQMRVMNTEAVTVNIAGTVEVDSTMDAVLLEDEFINSFKGVVLGGAEAVVSGTYNITGILNAPNAYMYSVYKGGSQTVNISGSQAKLAVKGIIDKGFYGDVATINLSSGGTLEVGSIVSLNPEIPGVRNFGNGTYRVLSTSTENRQIVFGATGENEYTTIDPYGNTLTFPGAVWKVSGSSLVSANVVYGSGAIKVASSVANGRVKFNNITTDYTGNITVAANSTMELVAGAYAGTITVEAGGTLEINPGASVDYTCNATLAGAGSVVIKSGTVTLANAPTVTSAISVDAGATLKLPTGTISGVTGSGTLEIPDGVEVTITANNVITVASLKGPGSLVLSGVGPGASNTTLQTLLQNSNWNGTFAIMNVAALNGLEPHLLGNSGSKLQLTGAAGYFARKNTAENVAAQPELVLVNGTGDYAYGFRTDNGYSYTKAGGASTDSYTIVRKLSGTGTLKDNNTTSQLYVFKDASGFSGSISQTGMTDPYGKTYLFATDVTPDSLPGQASNTTFDGNKATCGTIDVRAGAAVSIGNNCSWQSQNGIRIAGNVTLKGSARLSSATTFVGGAKLIFEAGSVLNATTVTLPSTGTVTLDVTGLTIPSAGYTLISGVAFTEADCDKFSITAGSGKYYALEPDGTTLKIFPNGASLTANQSVVRYESLMGAIMALYAPEFADAYVTELGDNTAYEDSDLLGINIAHDADGNYYKATVKIGSKGYKSLARAIELAADEDTVTLIRNNAESNVALSGKTVSVNETSFMFTGSFTGNGTLILGAALTSADPARWSEGWTGTVELKDITTVITDFDFADYGNANSTVRANNVLVRMNTETSGEYGAVKEINIASGGLKFDNAVAINEKTFTFSAKLTGTGSLRIGTPGGDGSHNTKANVTKYVFKGDISEFSGAVDYNELGSYRAAIVFADSDDVIPTSTDWGQIIVTEDVTLKSSGQLNGAGGFIVKGTIELLSGGSISTGGDNVAGDGCIIYDVFPSSAPAFNNSWAGEVHLPGNANIEGTNFGDWGKSSSKIVLDGDIAGWIAKNTSVSAEMVLDGHSLTVNDFSQSTYSFSKISGSGNISFNHKENGYQPSSLTIGEIAPTYSGTVNNNTTATLNINTIALAGGASVAAGTKLLKVGGTGSFSVGSVTVGGVTQSGLQLAYVANDGVYVAVATYGGNGYKTLAAAIAAATSGGTVALLGDCDEDVTLSEGIVFSNGGYSYTGTITAAASITVSSVTTYYATLAEAITASGNANLASITVLDEAATLPEGYYLSGSVGSKVVTLCAARSGEPGSYTYYNDVYAIFGAFMAPVKPVLTILDGNGYSYYTTISESDYSIAGLTYDSDNCRLFVAVAAIEDDKYPSLSEAIEMATDGQTIVLLSASSEAITLNMEISLSGTALFSGTLSGNGTIAIDTLPSYTIVANDWRGTVVLPEFSGDLYVARFGVSGSTIELTSMNGSFNKESWGINSFAIAPNIKISGTCTVNLEADGYSNLVYTFQTLSGSGTLTFTGRANQINIAKLAGYTGVLAYNNESPAVSISAIDFATRPASDAKILSTSGTGNITVANVTVNGVPPSPALRWVRRRNGSAGDGFYIQGGTLFSVY